MLKYNDKVIIEMYLEYNIPCDTLISDQNQFIAFTEDYMARSGQIVELSIFAKHLLSLRKRGEANGGLPRLRRLFQGKN